MFEISTLNDGPANDLAAFEIDLIEIEPVSAPAMPAILKAIFGALGAAFTWLSLQ